LLAAIALAMSVGLIRAPSKAVRSIKPSTEPSLLFYFADVRLLRRKRGGWL
jgi:hypothetical protein